VAVLEEPSRVLVSLISSQVDLHRPFGGVVPEVASRAHQEWLPLLVKQVMNQGFTPDDIDLLAVTRGPGLIGALLVGVSFVKALALAWKKPWVGVNHLAGHLASLSLADPPLEPPFVALLVSGGHTEFIQVDTDWNPIFLGGTLDDAAGEALDKVAQILGLGYPGGPEIQKAAADWQGEVYDFPVPMKGQPCCDISFSGLKTAVAMAIAKESPRNTERTAYWAASFQQCVVKALVEKLKQAVTMTGCRRIGVCGGVAANSLLRKAVANLAHRKGWESGVAPLAYCGDNAAMIALAGLQTYHKEGPSQFSLDADPRLFFSIGKEVL
jgi:N6-L-threonylcarbamoyladenine synthase